MLASDAASQGRLDAAPAGEPWLVVIAASAGGVEALGTVLSTLPADLNAAVAIVQHRRPESESRLHEILGRRTQLPVRVASGGEPIAGSTIYIARPDLHLRVERDRRFTYMDGRRVRFVRSSANPLFESAAPIFGNRLIAVVLTGYGKDGTDGVQTVKSHGGIVIAQDRESSTQSEMPDAAVRTGTVDYVLPLDQIGPMIAALVKGEPKERL